MSDALIRQLVESRLITWADQQGLQVEVENVAMQADPRGAFLSVYLLPAQSSGGFLEGGHVARTGVVQISIRDRLGGGVAECNRIAAMLSGLFPQNLRLTSGDFAIYQLTPLSMGPAFVSDGRYVLPTSFQYRADTTS
jgi:hypothetical protein